MSFSSRLPTATMWALRLAVSALCLLSAASASAQSERELMQRFQERMEHGQDLYVSRNYPEAAAEFLRAYEARPFSAALYNAALATDRAHNWAEAVSIYERLLSADPDAPQREMVEARLQMLRERLAEAEAQGGEAQVEEQPEISSTLGLISIESTPSGATITVTNAAGETISTGPTPFHTSVADGQYTLSVTHDECSKSREISVQSGRVYVFDFELQQCEFLGIFRAVSDPPGASIYIDDREVGAVGTTPSFTPLPIGEHTIWIERPGFEPQERTVTVEAGAEHVEEFSLSRVAYGRVRVTGSHPGAVITIDGEEVGQIPFEGRVEAGEHTIRVSADGQKDWEETFETIGGRVIPYRVQFRPTPSRAGGWVTAVLGLAAAGAATYLLIHTNNLQSALEIERDNGTLDSSDSRIQEGRILRYTMYGLFGFAGVMGALSVYFFLRNSGPDSVGRRLEDRDWTFTPHIDPIHRAGGATLQWTF